MKKIAFLFVLIICFHFTYGQIAKSKNIPWLVENTFQQLYPSADKVKWEKEGENYEVNFKVNKKKVSITLDSLGKLIEKEEDIEISQLPAKAGDYINKNYPKSKIKEVEKKTDAQGMITYEVEVRRKELIFDANGNLIKETKD
jgi:hypothetical protein